MSKTWSNILVTAVAIAAVVLTPTVAMACRITNATPWEGDTYLSPRDYKAYLDNRGHQVVVWFDCGHSCGSYFAIDPGTHVNSPGNSGYVQGCVHDYEDETLYKETGTRVKVGSSSEARVKNGTVQQGKDPYPTYEVSDPSKFHWEVYDSDNDLVDTVNHGTTTIDDRTGIDSPGQYLNYCWHGSP